MISALLAAAVALAPPPTPAICADPAPLGPAAAPLEIRFYLDPVVPGAHELWTELQRLIADLEGAVRIQPVIVASATHTEPHERAARAWAAAAIALGRAEPALLALETDGAELLAARARTAPDALAAALALPGEDLRRALADPCLGRALARGTAELREAIRRGPGRAGRPPAFIVGDRPVFEDGARLETLRREIDRALAPRRAGASIPPRAPRSVSARVTRPPADLGVLLGGPTLPHRLVAFVEQEDHPNFILLPPALAFRARHPGSLAIHVIARGSSPAAVRLRRRLCAARHLDVELEYLRVLALDYGFEGPRAADLRARLDAAADAHACPSEEERLEVVAGAPPGLPEGLWLDGAVVNHREVAAIEREILRIDRAKRPLDAVFSRAASAAP